MTTANQSLIKSGNTDYSEKHKLEFEKNDLCFVYTLMSEYSVYRGLCSVAGVYIKKLGLLDVL